MHRTAASLLTAACALSAAALGSAAPNPDASSHASPSRVYAAHLSPLNAGAAGSKTTGTARFTLRGDALTIDLDVQGAPPDMQHMQHLHGFIDGRDATCATAAADVNHDGVVDLLETEPMSGTTLVPLTADPVSLELASDTYPTANAAGTYHYEKTVSLRALERAFAEKFPGQRLELATRVVYIHGVPADTHLPATAASLGTIPAQVTLPIACGKVERSR